MLEWLRRHRVFSSRAFDVTWLVILFVGAIGIVYPKLLSDPSVVLERREQSANLVASDSTRKRTRISVRNLPRLIQPCERFRSYVDRGLLQGTLSKLEPLSPKPLPSVVMATHALRLWGMGATFPEGPHIPHGGHSSMWRFSCPTLLAFLTDDASFARFFPDAEPLLRATEHGILVRHKIGSVMDLPVETWPDCEAHTDKVVSVFAEIGLRSDYPISAPGRNASVRDLLTDSTMRFVPEQELEFSLKAYLHYLELPARWTNRQGNEIELNEVLRTLAHRELGEKSGACGGTHVCSVLALALRIDEDVPFLESARDDLVYYLKLASRRLEQSQDSSGAWPSDWSMTGERTKLAEAEGEAGARVRITGHHLEWIAIAPSSLCPSDGAVRRAIQFMEQALAELHADSFYHSYSPLTHAGRALLMLSGEKAAQ